MANEVRIEIAADTKRAERSVSDLNRRFQKMGGQMQSIGKKMSLGLTLPIVGLGAVAIKMGGNFEQSMNRVRAVSGATGANFAALSTQAKELGRTTQFSASQAAEGMSFLAMAGFKANEVLGAMPSTLQLAAAGQMELAQAADIASNILTGYRMTTEELAHANDVLVKTFTSTNTDLIMLGEAFKMVAPVASSAGLQFEEVSAAIGLLGNAGIQATMAGTALRGAVVRLLTPTDDARDTMQKLGLQATDSAGNLLSLEEIVRQLADSGATTADMMEIFGQRAGPGMAALVGQGADALHDLTAQLVDSGGSAASIAAVQMEGFNGAMRKMKSALEGAAIAFVETGILDMFQKLVEWVAKAAEKFANLPKALLIAVAAVAGLAAAVGPTLLILGTFLTLLPKITLALRAFAVASRLAAGPWGLILGAVAAIGGGYLISKLMGSDKIPGLQHGGGLPEGLSMVGEAGPEYAMKRGGHVSIIPMGKVPGFEGGTPGMEDIGKFLWEGIKPDFGAWAGLFRDLANFADTFTQKVLYGGPGPGVGEPPQFGQFAGAMAVEAGPQWWAEPAAFAGGRSTVPPAWLTEAPGAGFGVPATPDMGKLAWDWYLNNMDDFSRKTYTTGEVAKVAAPLLAHFGDEIVNAEAVIGPLGVKFGDLNENLSRVEDPLHGIGVAADIMAEREALLAEKVANATSVGFDYSSMVDSLALSLGDAGIAAAAAGNAMQEHLLAAVVEMADTLPGGAAVLQALTDSGATLEQQFAMLNEATGGLPDGLKSVSDALKKLKEEAQAITLSMVMAMPDIIKAGIPFAPGSTGAVAWAALAGGDQPMHGVGGLRDRKTAADLGIVTGAYVPGTGWAGMTGLPDDYVGPTNEAINPIRDNPLVVNIQGDVYGMEDFVDKVTEAVVTARAAGASV